jgi:hypothetical protein
VKVFTKAFQKVPLMRKKHGSRVYEYGYVWITLPVEAAGKPAVVKVIVIEEEPVEERPLAPSAPVERKAPEPPAQPAPPAPIQPLPPAQPLLPLVPQRERLSPELEPLLRALRARPEREPQLRDLLPFEEFTLEPEEERKEERKRRWPWLGRG